MKRKIPPRGRAEQRQRLPEFSSLELKVAVHFILDKKFEESINQLKGPKKAQATRIINRIRTLKAKKNWRYCEGTTNEISNLIHRLYAILNQKK